MKRYLVCYYAERDDVCTDLEKIIEADDIEKALKKFKDETRLYRSITSISLMPNMHLFENNSLIKIIETHDANR